MVRWTAVLLGWLLGLGAATAVLVASTAPVLGAVHGATSEPDAAVAAAAAVLAWLVLGWLALGLLLSLLEVVVGASGPARRGLVGGLAGAVAPATVRRVVHASLRVGVVAGVGGSAVLAPVAVHASPSRPAADVRLTDDPDPVDWPVLDRPAHPVQLVRSAPATPTTVTGAGTAPSPSYYRVRPGDSLWSIAAAHLPAGAAPGDVARAWPRWWRVNRQVVGDDPDLIRPGQLLRVPGGAS